MVKKFVLLIFFSAVILLNSSTVFADEVTPGGFCKQDGTSVCCNSATPPCVVDSSFECQPDPTGVAKYSNGSIAHQCLSSTVGSIFGKIKPPPALANFLKNDQTGAAGIGAFLSNLIILIYSLATIVLIFMLLWGAFDWMLSEGNKEKLQAAQSKIINAIIGILLFAVAFAIIQILGQFTGFTFFV